VPDFEVEKNLTIEEKILRALDDNGPSEVNEIAKSTYLKADSIRSTLNRKIGTTFGKLDDGKWTLLGPEGRPI